MSICDKNGKIKSHGVLLLGPRRPGAKLREQTVEELAAEWVEFQKSGKLKP